MANSPVRLVRDDAPPDPMRFNFTKHQLDRLTAHPARQTWAYDTKAIGLAMVVTPGGSKSFYYTARCDGRYRRMSLGKYPPMTIDQARRRATALAGDVATGGNPFEDRRQARDATTFGGLWDYYLERHAKVHKRTWSEDERQYHRYLKRWASRRLDEVTRSDVAALHEKVGRDAPVAANRLLALLSAMYGVAGSIGFDGPNPTKGVKRYREQSRERYLDADELPRFLAAVDDEDDPFRDYFRLLLYTGQRRDNVAGIEWAEIDLSRKVWTIPHAKFKSNRDLEVPLVTQAVKLLRERRKAAGDSPYVFPSRRSDAKTPYLTEPKGAMSRILEASKITNLRVHDLKRTVGSWATQIGTPYPTVCRITGHKPQGVTAVYARVDIETVRAALQATVDAMLATQAKAKKTTPKKKGGTRTNKTKA